MSPPLHSRARHNTRAARRAAFGNERTNERILGDTRHRRQGPSNTGHTPTRHQTPPEPSPKPLLTYALSPPAPRYPHSRHLPLLPPPPLPVELPAPLSPLSPLNPLNLEVAYVIYFPPYFAIRARVPTFPSRSAHPRHALAETLGPGACLILPRAAAVRTVLDPGYPVGIPQYPTAFR